MAFYRFSRACRQVIVNYLRWRLETVPRHWDGSDWIELPTPIYVNDARAYDIRRMPCVITDSAGGNIKSLGFGNIVADWIDTEGTYGLENVKYQVFGGRGELNISIVCASNDLDVQQQLTDVTAFYLIIGRTWLYYNRHILLGDVTISSDGVDDSVAQEPIYFCMLSVPVSADWRLLVGREMVSKVTPDIELVTPDDPWDSLKNIVSGVDTTMLDDFAQRPLGDYTPLEEDAIQTPKFDLHLGKPKKVPFKD